MPGSFLSCAACLRRTLQTASLETPALRPVLLPLRPAGRTRSYGTSSSPAAAPTKPVDAPQSLRTDPEDATVAQKKDRARLQRAVNKHLEHIEDPWKIAQHVEQTLAKDRFDEALLLTQQASKDRQVVVAWNHLISYLLGKQQLKKAVKLYNDVCRLDGPFNPDRLAHSPNR